MGTSITAVLDRIVQDIEDSKIKFFFAFLVKHSVDSMHFEERTLQNALKFSMLLFGSGQTIVNFFFTKYFNHY